MITASHLRRNIYQLLDEVAVTGVPLTINRRGRYLRIVSDEAKPSMLSKLKKRKIMNCDPENLVHIDWSKLQLITKDDHIHKHFKNAVWA